MNDEQTSGDIPALDRSEPTNAKLAALMVKQTQRILDSLANFSNPIGPKVHFEGMREALIRSLTTEEWRSLLPRWIVDEIPSDRDSVRSNTLVKILVDHFAHAAHVFATIGALEMETASRSPTVEEIAAQIEDALRTDAELEAPKFSEFAFLYLRQLVLDIRYPRGTAPAESVAPEKRERFRAEKCSRCGCTGLKEIEFLNSRFLVCGHCDLLHLTTEQKKVFCEYLKKDSVLLDEFEVIPLRPDAEPAVEFTPVSWDEYGKRIEASLAKSAKKEREMTAMLDGVLTAGLLAATEKGAVAIALAQIFSGMIPDDEPIHEIPEGWAPVALAINPATGEFLTIAGPRSEPDGRVEALETMLAKWGKDALAHTIGAVREAGRQPMLIDEYVITGPIDEGTCEECRSMIGKRVSSSKTADYLRGIRIRCECVNGCRLTVEHEDEPGASNPPVKNLEEGSEGE